MGLTGIVAKRRISLTKPRVRPSAKARAFNGRKVKSMMAQVPGWSVVKRNRIARKFEFSDFRSALKFVVEIGKIAEAQGHHPDIQLGWGKVQATTWTHDVQGLSKSDFLLAARINAIPH
jgi:4a-hydroxytetrahydrobiopterin dehydratase